MHTTPFPLPIALTTADRKALRARAHHLDPVVMIGDAGLSRAVLAEADRALGAHELIKIRVLGDDRAQRQAILTEICSALGCAAVQSIGKLLVVYRPKPIEDSAGRTRTRGPYLPKKLAATGATRRRKTPASRPSGKPRSAAAGAAPRSGSGSAAKTGLRSRPGNAAKAGPRGASGSAKTAPRSQPGSAAKAAPGSQPGSAAKTAPRSRPGSATKPAPRSGPASAAKVGAKGRMAAGARGTAARQGGGKGAKPAGARAAAARAPGRQAAGPRTRKR